jgi:hypothetical protein
VVLKELVNLQEVKKLLSLLNTFLCILFHIRHCPPVYINQTVVPQVQTVKYLGQHFDKRLTLKDHVLTKWKHLDHKTHKIYWLIGKHSPFSLENKLLIYKTVLKPVWTYGIEMWGSAAKSNLAVIQRYQSKLLRNITSAPRYVSNHTLHSDLRIPHVRTGFQEQIATHRLTLASRPNPLIEPLLHPPQNRRLRRRWPLDEIH